MVHFGQSFLMRTLVRKVDISQEGGLWSDLSTVDIRKVDFGQSFLLGTLGRCT